MFSIIAAIGKNRELGRNNQLVFHIKEDMQFFKKNTENHPVVMGRKTWDSLPGKLKNRTNIVISRHEVPGADETISDIPAFIAKNQDTDEEFFIIGGGSIYKEFLPYAKNIYLTEVDATADADTFFPEFNRADYSLETIKTGTENNTDYQINKYTKKEN
jgi:dihydrofolate reductase